jgi:drug/metabolite transporter (DMT)-like permease
MTAAIRLVDAPPLRHTVGLAESPTTASTPTIGPVQVAQLLFLGAVWGGAFLFLRIAAPEVGAVWAAEIRIAIGALVLVAIAGPRTWRVARHDLRAFAVVGATFSAVPFTLVALAAVTLPAGFGAALNATTPLFTALFGVVWLGQRMSVRLLAGLATGIVAVTVLVGWAPLEPGLTTIVAALAAVGAAVSYGFAGTYVRRRLPAVGGLELATAQLVAAAIMLLPVAVASGAPGTPSVGALVALVAVGTLSTALPWPIFYRLLAATTPTVASTVTFIVPGFAMAWGAIVLGEPIGVELLAGFGLVVTSLVLVLGISLPTLGRSLVARPLSIVGARL